MSKKIRVRLQAERVVRWDKEVIMSEEEFNTLQSTTQTDISERENQQAFCVLDVYLDMHDIFDSDTEFRNVEAERVTVK